MSQVVIISGSPSSASRTRHVLEYVQAFLHGEEISVSLVDVLDIPAEDLTQGRFDSPAVQSVSRTIQSADGVILGTPVYKASFTGVLKSLLDLLDRNALADKVVLPIALGGSPHHFLMLDYAFKPVLSALGARHIPGGVYILDTQVNVSQGGETTLEEEAKNRLDKTLQEFVRSLGQVNSASLSYQ